eukprot:5981916-Pleurochrysis_carterae.AAC.2
MRILITPAEASFIKQSLAQSAKQPHARRATTATRCSPFGFCLPAETHRSISQKRLLLYLWHDLLYVVSHFVNFKESKLTVQSQKPERKCVLSASE